MIQGLTTWRAGCCAFRLSVAGVHFFCVIVPVTRRLRLTMVRAAASSLDSRPRLRRVIHLRHAVVVETRKQHVPEDALVTLSKEKTWLHMSTAVLPRGRPLISQHRC
ncbi:unnamed protein product [Bodo saltans]|uniref:Uncharacterized protein n=1 Tax=Bodo saltans TaxID=75058 RepID=A0A0S4IH89_BODSA|nr:unnamed protein product [Bodo saltans]|eukprot:CUE61301.1 unnamed protein product [Bodo saltans]